MEAKNTILRLDDVSITLAIKAKAYHALSNLSFEMNRGEVVVIVGDSGAGKSTLLHFIAGLLAPKHHRRFPFGIPAGYIRCERASGRIFLSGKEITDLEPIKRSVGLVLQQHGVYEHMTARRNLEFPLILKGESRIEASKKVLNVAGSLRLSKFLDQMPSTLSGGQQQRVALGKLLLKNPVLALLDEAFAHVDPLIENDITDDLLKSLRDENTDLKGLIIVSHALRLTSFAHKILLFRREENADSSHVRVFVKNGKQSALEAMQACNETLFRPWCELVKKIVPESTQ